METERVNESKNEEEKNRKWGEKRERDKDGGRLYVDTMGRPGTANMSSSMNTALRY